MLLFSPWFLRSQTWVSSEQLHGVRFTSASNPSTRMAMGIHTPVNQDFTRTKGEQTDPLILKYGAQFQGPLLSPAPTSSSSSSSSPGSSMVLDQAFMSLALLIAPVYALKPQLNSQNCWAPARHRRATGAVGSGLS